MFFSCTQHSLVEPYNVLAANKSVSRLLVKRILLVLLRRRFSSQSLSCHKSVSSDFILNRSFIMKLFSSHVYW